MSNNWNLAEIEKYSKEYARITCFNHFTESDAITGSEILTITNIKQLNLFILKELFDNWQIETTKLKNVYFDYTHTEVKQALDDFMNVLSRHILINKVDFEPLVAKATKNTLELYIEPKQHFKNELRNLPEFKLTKDWLKNNGRFYHDYNWVLAELLNRVNGLQFVFANEGIDWVQEIISDKNHEDHTLELNEIKNLVDIQQKEKIEEKIENKTSFFDTINTEPKTAVFERPSVTSIEVLQKVEFSEATNATGFENNSTVQPSMAAVALKGVSVETRTLNEILQDKNMSSLSDFHQKRKIETIKGNISLNQKFLFINNLFDGDSGVFNAAVDELESCVSFNDAKAQMIKNYMPRYKWNLNSAEVEEFFDLLKRRFN